MIAFLCFMPVQLFVPATADNLTEKQQAIYRRIEAQPATVRAKVYKVNKASLQGKFIIEFAFDEVVSIAGLSVEGKTISVGRSKISVVGDSLSGLIYAGDKVYSVEPLGGEYICVALVDQAKFPKEK